MTMQIPYALSVKKVLLLGTAKMKMHALTSVKKVLVVQIVKKMT